MRKERFNLLQGGIYYLGTFYTELIRTSEYNWLTGHLSDITLPAQTTTLGIIISSTLFKNNKYLNLASALIPPILSTINELKILNLDPSSNTYDPQDIACFFAGSFLAYGLSMANEKKVCGKISNRVKGAFGKKSLENSMEEK